MLRILSLFALVAAVAGGAVSVTGDNAASTLKSGKNAFVKFQAPW